MTPKVSCIELDLPDAVVGQQLESQLFDFMNDVSDIHFNLDGVIVSLDAAKLNKLLELGELRIAATNATFFSLPLASSR